MRDESSSFCASSPTDGWHPREMVAHRRSGWMRIKIVDTLRMLQRSPRRWPTNGTSVGLDRDGGPCWQSRGRSLLGPAQSGVTLVCVQGSGSVADALFG